MNIKYHTYIVYPILQNIFSNVNKFLSIKNKEKDAILQSLNLYFLESFVWSVDVVIHEITSSKSIVWNGKFKVARYDARF